MTATTDMYSVKANDMVGPKAATEATTLTTRHLAQARCARHPVSAATL
ncbi:hypothetical protein ACJ6YJ_25945 [Pseudomonas marginalis]